MEILLVVLIVLVVIGSLVGTLYVGKEVNQTIKKYQAEGDSFKEQLHRSNDYEVSSLKKNIPMLTWIYIIAFGVAGLAVIIYILII